MIIISPKYYYLPFPICSFNLFVFYFVLFCFVLFCFLFCFFLFCFFFAFCFVFVCFGVFFLLLFRSPLTNFSFAQALISPGYDLLLPVSLPLHHLISSLRFYFRSFSSSFRHLSQLKKLQPAFFKYVSNWFFFTFTQPTKLKFLLLPRFLHENRTPRK